MAGVQVSGKSLSGDGMKTHYIFSVIDKTNAILDGINQPIITVHPVTYNDRGEPVIGETAAQIEGTTITYQADIRNKERIKEAFADLMKAVKMEVIHENH